MRLMRRNLLPFLIVCLYSQILFSQNLKGKLLNESGRPASGVKIHFKSGGTVSSDESGIFKLEAKKLPDTLFFESPLYETYKILITEKNIRDPNFEVVMLSRRDRYAFGPDDGL